MNCIRNDYRINSAGYANHRQVYEQKHGPVPKDKVVMHTCGNRWCVNPDHMEVGTQHENRMEQVRRGVNPKQVISFEEAELIRWAGRQGPKRYGWGAAVAREFGVSTNTISNLRLGKTFQEAG